MRIFDNLLAIRILYLLVAPYEKTPAYALGLISKDGEFLKKAKTPEEVDATSMLHRLVWRIKRFINMVPGGSTKIGSIIAAYALVRECVDSGDYNPDVKWLIESVDRLSDQGRISEDLAANITGEGVSTDVPTIKLKNKPIKRFTTDKELPIDGSFGIKRISSILNMESESGIEIFRFIKQNASAFLIIESETETKIVHYQLIKSAIEQSYSIEIRKLW